MFTSPLIPEFEDLLGELLAAEVVLLPNCTLSLYASLLAQGVGPGSVVAVPAYTYVGTVQPAIALGADVVCVDVKPSTGNMSPESLRAVLTTHQISTVIVAHLFGNVASRELLQICEETGTPVVHDCAQYFPGDDRLSSLLQTGPVALSFGESKLLRVGEGGAVVTTNNAFAEDIRKIRHEGEGWLTSDLGRLNPGAVSPSQVFQELASLQTGLNLRPTAMAAALGISRLRGLAKVRRHFTANASVLSNALHDVSAIRPVGDQDTVWWTFPVLVDTKEVSRDTVLAALLAEGVPAGVHFPRLIPDHPAVAIRLMNRSEGFLGAKEFATRHIVLPIYDRLDADSMILVACALEKVCREFSDLRSAEALADTLLSESSVDELSSGLFLFLSPNS